MSFSVFVRHTEFEKFGLAVLTSKNDKLMVEIIPKRRFYNTGYKTIELANNKIQELIQLDGTGVLKDNLNFINCVYKNDYKTLKLDDFIHIAESIFSKILNQKFILKNHAKVIILPKKEYENLEKLVRLNEKETVKKYPYYYQRTSAMLLEGRYIIIKDPTYNIQLLHSIVHETGHLIMPHGLNEKRNEYYAYMTEFIFWRLFNIDYLLNFPQAKIIEFKGGNTASEIHDQAYDEALKVYTALLSNIRSP